jgi:uncharacterized membrane protein
MTYDDKLPHLGALLFATGFYLIFFLANILNNIREQKKFLIVEILMLISNTFLYYSAGMYILADVEKGIYQGLFTALIAIFNLVFAYSLFRSKKVETNVLYLLIGLVLTFASLAAPVQLEGNYITLFWAMEAVLLLWLSQKSHIQLIKIASFIVMLLMLVSLLMDWGSIYNSYIDEKNPHTLFINQGLVTSLVSIVSILVYMKLLNNEPDELFSIKKNHIRTWFSVVFIAVTYVGLLLEVQYQVGYRIEHYAAHNLFIGVYQFGFMAVLIFWLNRKVELIRSVISIVLLVVASLSYVFYYNLMIAQLRDEYLTQHHYGFQYYFHFVLLLLFVCIIWQNRQLIFKTKAIVSPRIHLFNGLFCFLLIYLLSAEIEHLLVVSSYSGNDYTVIYETKNMVFKIIFPILWGLCSFGMMYFGMNTKNKTVRIISLIVFSITLLKLFIFDVTEMSEGGKIAAFISLGVLLLIISFMYQKLKKIIVDDEQKQHE